MVDGLRSWLSREGAAAAVVTRPVSMRYLCGFGADPRERLMALVLRPDSATLVVPGLEAEAARVTAAGVDVRAWVDGQDPFELIARVAGRAPVLAVEKDDITLGRAEQLQALLGAERLVDVGAELRRRRAVKTGAELELLARAAAVTDEVTEAILSELAPGRSETELARRLAELIEERGGGLSFDPLVQSGPNSALPHLPPTRRRLEPGDLVLLDFGAAVEGYCADTTRMAVVGEAGAREREVHAAVLEANRAGVAAVRAGVTAGEVDAAAREVLERAGLGEAFIHRTGHGLGLEEHEAPSLEADSSLVLEPGMVVTVEPGAYLPGWGGIRIEDDVVVEEGGGRVLTAASRELAIV
jgi:Xaa-Pro dipeptidase